jgi:hypothetical protein
MARDKARNPGILLNRGILESWNAEILSVKSKGTARRPEMLSLKAKGKARTPGILQNPME